MVRKSDPFSAPVEQVLYFLADRFEAGLSHSSINVSALRSLIQHDHLDGAPIGQHILQKKLMCGVFRSRPPIPMYVAIWDVCLVAQDFCMLSPASSLPLKWLTLKLPILVSIQCGSRANDLPRLDLAYADVSNKEAIFVTTGGKVASAACPFQVHKLLAETDRRFCYRPTTLPQEYVLVPCQSEMGFPDGRTSDLFRLFLSYTRPHQELTSTTISLWLCIYEWVLMLPLSRVPLPGWLLLLASITLVLRPLRLCVWATGHPKRRLQDTT